MQALEVAEGGALYLDEIARLPADAQVALMGVIEDGSSVRIMTGSTGELSEDKMNSDLYYRLQVSSVRVPSLSERPEDIPVLFSQYIDQASEQAGLTVPEVTPDHMAALMAQEWPGNARSLMSAAMRYVLGMPEDVVDSTELGLAEQMARVERSLLVAALSRQNGRASEAAKELKLPRKTFYDKLNRYGIRPEDYR